MSSTRKRHARLRVEVGTAFFAAFAALLTVVYPAWIETIFSTKPDGGGGSLEAAITVSLAVAAIASGLLARFEWHRISTPGIGGS